MKRAYTAIIGLLVAFSIATAAARIEVVYVTPEGCCYHLGSCRTIKKNKHLEELTVEQAKARGRRACKICKP